MTVKLYAHHGLPTVWVAIDNSDDSAWIIFPVPGGWHQRRPYSGRRQEVEPVADFYGIGLGLPGRKA